MKTDRRELWLLVGITFLGSVLRLADLTGRSMWLDEGFTLIRLNGTWDDIIRNVVYLQGIRTIDLHPPFYFLLLRGWRELLGGSEFALKLVPAFASIMLIPATYALGHRLFTRRVAILAALLVLLSPAYQWYGHELRMYTLVPLLAALSGYSIFAAVQTRRMTSPAWIAWVGLMAILLFTHYSGVGLLLAQLVFAGLVIVHKRPKVSRRDIALTGCFVLLLVIGGVIAGVATDMSHRVRQLMDGLGSNGAETVPIDAILSNVINSALFGMNASDPTHGFFTWFVVFACAVGLLWSVHLLISAHNVRRTVSARLYLGLTLLLPIVFVFLLSFAIDNRPSFRYSIVTLPSIHVLLAYVFVTALAQVRRARVSWLSGGRAARAAYTAIGLVAMVSVFAAQSFGLTFTFLRTTTWQDDWRGMTQYIRDHWQPGDVLFINLFTPEAVIGTYLGDLPMVTVPLGGLVSTPRSLRDLTRDYKRVWYSNTGGATLNMDSAIGQWLTSLHKHGELAFPGQTNVLQLMLFDLQPSVLPAPPATAQVVKQEGDRSADAEIAAYEVQSANPYHRYPNARLSLYWRRPAKGKSLADYNVAVRIKTPDQRLWADWFMPAGLESAPPTWGENNLYREDYVIPLPVGLLSQSYLLELSVGVGEKAEVIQLVRRPIDPAQVGCCIRITRWPPAPKKSPVVVLWQHDGTTLVNAEFTAQGNPGEVLPVVLTWQLDKPATANWQTVLSIDGLLGGNVVTQASESGSGEVPVSSWPLEEPVRTLQAIQLPYTIQPGYYRLSALRKFSDGRPSDGFFLGTVEVKEYPMTPVAHDIPHPAQGKMGELALLGYSVDQPFRRSVTLRLHVLWRVDNPPARDGVLFLHVRGPDGKMIAQDDNPPEQGKRSTLTYRSGEGIDQVHRVVIPANAPAGEYQLYAGVYDRLGGGRWTAEQGGEPARDDLLFLGVLSLPDQPYRDRVFMPYVSW